MLFFKEKSMNIHMFKKTKKIFKISSMDKLKSMKS